MRRSALFASFVKEMRLLGRDIHGLALLFLLPLAFILVMSLALQDLFAARAGGGIDVLVIDRGGGEYAQSLQERLSANAAYALRRADATANTDAVRRQLRGGAYAFALEIAPDYDTRLTDLADTSEAPLISIIAAADTSRQTELIFTASVREALERQRAELLLGRIGFAMPEDEDERSAARVSVEYAYATEQAGEAPTAVQQNVPAWLVFALFFVAAPFSNAFIRERQVGTQRRLRSTNAGVLTQFFGKLAPYFVVNQLQVALMLAAGVFLVPLLGGEALRVHGEPLALVLLSAALGVAALGLALLIAVTARTTEQALMLAGLGNIVLAAVGGVMVPKFVMPAAMQRLADLSPMAWGVDGFLGLFLRDAGVVDIAPELIKLTAFGLITLVLAWAVYRAQE